MQQNYEKRGMILVAMDGSPYSLSAARIAIHIAQITKQMVYGLYVVESGLIAEEQNSLSRPAMLINLEAAGNQALNILKLECHKAGVGAVTEIVLGNVPEAIQQKEDQSILVAIGRRGQGHPNGSEFLGEHLRPICHMLNKPVLVGGEVEPHIRRILLAAPNESGLHKSIEAVSRFGRSLLEEVSRPENRSVPKKSERNTISGSKNVISSVNDLVKLVSKSAGEIAKDANDQKIDLLILAGYPKITPLGWLEGTLPEQVIRKVKIPVIIF